MLEQQKQQIDTSVSLGRLMWYSVTEDTMVDYKTMVMELANVGLNLKVPPVPRDFNVFKRVSSDAQRKVRISSDPVLVEHWMVRDVAGRNEETIVRRIVMEERDSANRKLSYRQIVDVEFNRTTGKMHFRWMPDCDDAKYPTAQDMLLDITANFRKWKGMLNHYAIREWIRKTILDMGATSVRQSGSLYFLKEAHAGDVEKLELFVDRLPGGNECHSLPLVDNEKQRKMVRKALEAETNDAVDHLLSEIRQIKKDGKLTPARFAEILSEAKQLQAKTKDYAGLLQTTLREIDSRLTILHKQALSLNVLQRRRGTKDPSE